MKEFDIVCHYKLTNEQFEELKDNLIEININAFYICKASIIKCNDCIFVNECDKDAGNTTPEIKNVVHIKEKEFTKEEREIMKHLYGLGFRYMTKEWLSQIYAYVDRPCKGEEYAEFYSQTGHRLHLPILNDKITSIKVGDDPVEIAKYIGV